MALEVAFLFNFNKQTVHFIFIFLFQRHLTRYLLKYHESGFIEELKDLYFRRSKCNDNDFDGQLQGEASGMVFEQHAGLYLLLLVGIFVCILLMFLEHATFKWLVPYWRKKPNSSFWKSYSMMFWSQVCHTLKSYFISFLSLHLFSYVYFM